MCVHYIEIRKIWSIWFNIFKYTFEQISNCWTVGVFSDNVPLAMTQTYIHIWQFQNEFVGFYRRFLIFFNRKVGGVGGAHNRRFNVLLSAIGCK